jgi:uncharacterized protein (DUF1015 family)
VIRVHEHTRPDKELDRLRHLDALSAHDEPVFYLSPRVEAVEAVIAAVTRDEPAVAFEAEDVTHRLWVVADPARVRAIEAGYAGVPHLYVADGHHRSAAAVRLHDLRAGQPGEHDAFLTVVFALDQVRILPYHRVVTDLGGLTPAGLLDALAADFDVTGSDAPVEPDRRGTFGMFLDGRWYRLSAHRPAGSGSLVGTLDVSRLQDRVLSPLLGIGDPRTDGRIGFVGGIRGPAELERLVRSGSRAVAFSLHPTSVDDLTAIADAGQVMPPKSTWFEPKLRSGLFVHAIGT